MDPANPPCSRGCVFMISESVCADTVCRNGGTPVLASDSTCQCQCTAQWQGDDCFGEFVSFEAHFRSARTKIYFCRKFLILNSPFVFSPNRKCSGGSVRGHSAPPRVHLLLAHGDLAVATAAHLDPHHAALQHRGLVPQVLPKRFAAGSQVRCMLQTSQILRFFS